MLDPPVQPTYQSAAPSPACLWRLATVAGSAVLPGSESRHIRSDAKSIPGKDSKSFPKFFAWIRATPSPPPPNSWIKREDSEVVLTPLWTAACFVKVFGFGRKKKFIAVARPWPSEWVQSCEVASRPLFGHP